MGKQVAVASSIFNLMGPEDQRPHYLKSLIISAIREEVHSVADVITEGYKNGPGMRIRNFYNWAKNNEEFQEQLGITSGELKVPVEVDMRTLAAQLPQEPGRFHQIESVLIGEADILHWAEQWVARHYPDLYHTDWECDHDLETNMITITFEDGTTEEFEAHSYEPDGRYLYVKYTSYPINGEGEVLLKIYIYKKGSGSEVLDSFFETTTSAGGFYPTIPFRYNNIPIAGKPFRWRIRLPFDFPLDARDETIKFAASEEAAQNEKNIRVGRFIDYAGTGSSRDIIVQGWIGTQFGNNKIEDILNRYERPVVMSTNPNTPNEWRELLEKPIPIIPSTVDTYKLCKKAFRKAFNADYEELLQKINNHKNIRDIDYASVVFGVPLNTKENASKKYIYKFLQHLMNHQPDKETLDKLKEQLGHVRMQFSVRSVHKDAKTVNFRNHYEWSLITEERGTGILKEGKKKGDLWFERVDFPNVVALCWQETANRWRKITVHDFTHKNQIYGSKSVITRAVDAINDDETSGFIILLHEDLYHSLSLVDRTQMATACAYLVFNCYEVRKTNFWEDWGPIILIAAFVIAAVAITIATGGAGIGLLGSAEAVGAALGLSGTTALIVGATANALAALLVGFILTEGAILALGDKWGRIVGIISTAILTIGISAGVNSVNIIEAFTKPENLIKISQATTDAYNSYVEASVAELNQQAQEMWNETSKEVRRILEMMEEFSGFREIDPANVREYISELTERVEDFLSRTLLTGSDIAEIQRFLLTNFAENTISTELP